MCLDCAAIRNQAARHDGRSRAWQHAVHTRAWAAEADALRALSELRLWMADERRRRGIG